MKKKLKFFKEFIKTSVLYMSINKKITGLLLLIINIYIIFSQFDMIINKPNETSLLFSISLIILSILLIIYNLYTTFLPYYRIYKLKNDYNNELSN